ncbi:lysophospholipid acyltransferase family protein [Mesomycoplasma lagogenitalium]|uniref:Lysophospholipid acyltransferase family protein n=1 Tax=Mesomycoplasma lagogenitalium TaxID=171286 RepID=A0ABY8LT63_9BACT|nr:lysophospholipid acyltransferase family protein [Mesomycoplasma lagogenitalium]WGI36439.1 lysophospholipid acyltransferase family protein [Mesomycoplasma lagogenitalium]
MNIKIKLALFSLPWLYRLNKIRKLSKKYRKGKEELTAQFRNDLILKYSSKLLKLFNVEINVIGKEKITKGGVLVVANHVSNGDSFVLFNALQASLENPKDTRRIATFLAKVELKSKKTARNILELIDTFFIDRSKIKESVKTIDDFGRFVKENKTYGIIFPEGTRTKDGEMQDFKAGAFRVAKKNYLPIVPITINNSGAIFDTSRSKKLVVDVIVHNPIKASEFSTQTNEAIASRVKQIISSKYVKGLPEKRKNKGNK